LLQEKSEFSFLYHLKEFFTSSLSFTRKPLTENTVKGFLRIYQKEPCQLPFARLFFYMVMGLPKTQ